MMMSTRLIPVKQLLSIKKLKIVVDIFQKLHVDLLLCCIKVPFWYGYVNATGDVTSNFALFFWWQNHKITNLWEAISWKHEWLKNVMVNITMTLPIGEYGRSFLKYVEIWSNNICIMVTILLQLHLLYWSCVINGRSFSTFINLNTFLI